MRPLNLEPSKPKLTRDPRFDSMSGNLNEGLFRESYSFVKDLRNERINTLKEYIGQGKDKKGEDYKQKVHKLREMLGEERDAMNKAAQKSKDKAILKEAKLENRQRAEKGLEPKYMKKKELKEMRHKEHFEKLEKSGKLKEFIEKQTEIQDKKRVQR